MEGEFEYCRIGGTENPSPTIVVSIRTININLANCFKPVTAALVYSFTAPVMMPLTKYFWMKG